MPVSAACRTCTPLPMLSSRLPMSLARASRPAAVKKLVGLSSALLTFLPVARRGWGAGGGEKVGGFFGGVFALLAGGKGGLGSGEKGPRILQGEQILANCRRKDDIGHLNAFLKCTSQTDCYWPTRFLFPANGRY